MATPTPDVGVVTVTYCLSLTREPGGRIVVIGRPSYERALFH